MHHKTPLSRIKQSIASDWSLSDLEVENARIQFGSNNIVESSGNRWLELSIETIKDPMIWFLVVASVLFAILKNYNQTMILLLATLPLIGMDAFLHWRTSASTKSLSKSLATTVLVIRNGLEKRIPALEIVPGDLLVVTPSLFFPADGLIVGGKDIQVDESALTGEAFPAQKKVITSLPDHSSEPSINETHWGFAGTRLLTGKALLRVIYTGKETFYGEIVSSTIETANERTPLQKSIADLVFQLIIIASILCLLLAAVRLYQGFGLIDAILSAAILAVAALPDEFPVVFTFFLGYGVYRLAIKKALVKRAVSVENIGRVTCICSDKTGTLTKGQFTLKESLPAINITETTLLQSALLASRLDSNDPLDRAVYQQAERLEIKSRTTIHTFPFTEGRKRETALIKLDNNHFMMAVKGAPEIILDLSSLNTIEREDWLKKASELSALGYKVIGCAQYLTEKEIHIEPEKNYQFLGLLVFSDPIRQEVPLAIKRCLESGIHVLMLTGDHPETAKTVAKEIGLGNGHPTVVLAETIQSKLEKGNGYFLHDIDVIARTIPSQKLFIVKALQASGEIVAVTGDGVNDVPALKAADVGISMGERGTQSAREISDIILLDDNFKSIVNAISEGRQLFKNLKLSFQYLIMIHIPFVLSAAIVPLFGFPLIYLPIHIVWVELFIHPTAMLVFQEKSDQDEKLDRVQKGNRLIFFSKKEWVDIFLLGSFSTLFITLGYVFFLKETHNTEHARAFVLASLGFINVSLTMGLSKFKTIVERSITLLILILTLTFIQTPFIAKAFDLTPLRLSDWLVITFFSLVIFGLLKRLKR